MNIIENPTIDQLNYIPKLFFQAYGISEQTIYYRPLFPATYYLEYPIWGNRAWGYRLNNILLHIIVVLLIYQISKIILKNPFGGFIASFIYAVHPVHVESVAWISGRVDLLSGLFYFLGFYFYLKYRENPGYSTIYFFIGSLCCYLLGLLSKEMAITLPLLIIFYDTVFPPDKNNDYPISRRIPIYTGYILIFINYLMLRRYATGMLIGTGSLFDGLLGRIYTIPGLLTDYIRLLLLPIHLNADYIFMPISGIFNYQFLLPFITISIIFYLLFYYRKSNKTIYFSVLFIFIALIPVLNIIPVRDSLRIQAERFLYIPAFGYAVLIGHLFIRLFQGKNNIIYKIPKNYFIIILAVLISFYSIRTVYRNMDWKNDNIFFSRMTIDSPLSFRGYLELGNIELGNLNPTGAIPYYLHALSLDSTRTSIYMNLGNAYGMLGKLDIAMNYLNQAYRISPHDSILLSNLAFYHFMLGDEDNLYQAIVLFHQANRQSPGLYFNHFLLAQTYEKLKYYDKAIEAYRESIRLNPHYIPAINQLEDLLNKHIQTQ